MVVAVNVGRVPLPLLIALFVLVPLLELYLLFKVGDSIGIELTILLLLADSVIGSLLLRSQGRAVWRRFNEALATGRMPHREVTDGVAVIFGGAFLITPGFLTDIVGLLLLLGPTRAVIVKFAGRRVASRMTARVTDTRRGHNDFDVEGTATEQASPDAPRLKR